jgi:hypothetical protein
MDMVLQKALSKELRVYPQFLDYHGAVEHIPLPGKFGHNKIYTSDQVTEIRAFVARWKKHRAEIKALKDQV